MKHKIVKPAIFCFGVTQASSIYCLTNFTLFQFTMINPISIFFRFFRRLSRNCSYQDGKNQHRLSTPRTFPLFWGP